MFGLRFGARDILVKLGGLSRIPPKTDTRVGAPRVPYHLQARLEGREQIVVVFLRDRDKMHEKPSPCEGPKIKRDLKECIEALGFRV